MGGCLGEDEDSLSLLGVPDTLDDILGGASEGATGGSTAHVACPPHAARAASSALVHS